VVGRPIVVVVRMMIVVDGSQGSMIFAFAPKSSQMMLPASAVPPRRLEVSRAVPTAQAATTARTLRLMVMISPV